MIIYRIVSILSATLVFALLPVSGWAEGFSEADVVFYGEVRQVGGAHAVQLQAGTLQMTLVNQRDPANRVRLSTELRPTGEGAVKPWSYVLPVPLHYLPHAVRKESVLSIGAQAVDFRIEDITIDGVPAVRPDGSREFFPLSFASRGAQLRLDLRVKGDSTDTDGDGLPDWWERLHELRLLTADAEDDPDADGWSNAEELRRGSDPNQSNREPGLATAEVRVPEGGEAGLLLQFLDADTPPAGLAVSFPDASAHGFELCLDDVPMRSGSPTLSLEDLETGRLTVRHVDATVRSIGLPVRWNDGTGEHAGSVTLRVDLPSAEDGGDAALWLDATRIAADEGAVDHWPDRSGRDQSASQPAEAYRPRRAQHASGRATLDFTGPEAHLFFRESVLPNGDHTVLAAYRSDASSDAPQTLFAGNRGFLQLAPTGQAVSYPGAPTYQVDGLAVQGYESALSEDSVSIFRREGAVLQSIFGLAYDGEAVGGTALEPTLPTLGARRPALPGDGNPVRDGFHGQLHEVLVFPGALAEQKLRDVHDYLRSKWGGAVIWDQSTGLRGVRLMAEGDRPHILRGGWGDDSLCGGPLADTLSGGPGADTLTGRGGADRFVFGGVDTGMDVITDFDPEADIVDLSALFWGRTGDARNYISLRLDTDTSTAIPTLNTVLVVRPSAEETREIVLRGVILTAAHLDRLIVEGRIHMGSLSVPARVKLALAPGSSNLEAFTGAPGERLLVEVRREGDGTAGAMDIPLGFFGQALGGNFVLEGATSREGRHATVRLDAGETSRVFGLRAIPGLEALGSQSWALALLPQHRYEVDGDAVNGTLTDRPRVWVDEVVRHALVDLEQAAWVRFLRGGDLTQGLTIQLDVGGTAREGEHVQTFLHRVEFAAGRDTAYLFILPQDGWDASEARRLRLSVVPDPDFQLGSPASVEVLVGESETIRDPVGFEGWLAAATQGAATSYHHLRASMGAEQADGAIRAYAMGLDSLEDLSGHGMVLRVVNGRPEISLPWRGGRDVGVSIRVSGNMQEWLDASEIFTADTSKPARLRLIGPPAEELPPPLSFHLVHTVDQSPSLASGVATLTGGTRFGLEGGGRWTVDADSGTLLGEIGGGTVHRLIAEAEGPVNLQFDMSVSGAVGAGSLAFYIDGARVAQTDGAELRVQRFLPGPRKALLMWESTFAEGRVTLEPVP